MFKSNHVLCSLLCCVVLLSLAGCEKSPSAKEPSTQVATPTESLAVDNADAWRSFEADAKKHIQSLGKADQARLVRVTYEHIALNGESVIKLEPKDMEAPKVGAFLMKPLYQALKDPQDPDAGRLSYNRETGQVIPGRHHYSGFIMVDGDVPIAVLKKVMFSIANSKVGLSRVGIGRVDGGVDVSELISQGLSFPSGDPTPKPFITMRFNKAHTLLEYGELSDVAQDIKQEEKATQLPLHKVNIPVKSGVDVGALIVQFEQSKDKAQRRRAASAIADAYDGQALYKALIKAKRLYPKLTTITLSVPSGLPTEVLAKALSISQRRREGAAEDGSFKDAAAFEAAALLQSFDAKCDDLKQKPTCLFKDPVLVLAD